MIQSDKATSTQLHNKGRLRAGYVSIRDSQFKYIPLVTHLGGVAQPSMGIVKAEMSMGVLTVPRLRETLLR